MKIIKSPIIYMGNKGRIIDQLFNNFPKKVCCFYDLFGGSGVVALNATKIATGKVVYNEINKHTFNLFKLVTKDYQKNEDLAERIETEIAKWQLFFVKAKETRHYELSKILEENYNHARNFFNQNLENISYIHLYTLHLFSHNSLMRFNLKGELNSAVGINRSVNWKKNLLEMQTVKKKKIFIKNEDFGKIVGLRNIMKEDFVYIDPPHLIGESDYSSSWNEKHEKRLYLMLEYLNQRGVKWAMSNVISNKGESNILLKEWSKKWWVQEIKINYSPFGSNSKKGKTKEVLITNYDSQIYQNQMKWKF